MFKSPVDDFVLDCPTEEVELTEGGDDLMLALCEDDFVAAAKLVYDAANK